jgi:hypothetical protein
MRCGLMFNQRMLEANMLEFCLWFCAPFFKCLLLDNTSLVQAYCHIVC